MFIGPVLILAALDGCVGGCDSVGSDNVMAASSVAAMVGAWRVVVAEMVCGRDVVGRITVAAEVGRTLVTFWGALAIVPLSSGSMGAVLHAS